MKYILASLFIILVVFQAPAQTNQAPVKLAIISETPEAGTAADVLTAEFSKKENVHLLERAEIDRIYREQGLSAANTDYLKLGQLLGADGLLLLGTSAESTNQFLNARLIATKPGVVLIAEKFSWPIDNMMEWSSSLTRHLQPFFSKLAVLVPDAIPISILNLRSAIQTADTRETERQLTLLAIARLSREPQLFVLERQRMELLSTEKALKGLDESPFWNGSYLLDGTVDNHGYSSDTITISARLVPPKGGTVMPIEVSGSRTNLGEVINRLGNKILENLKLRNASAPWNAADEGKQYFIEAEWALKWKLYPQAQTAAEAAWALGQNNPEAASLLIRTYNESMQDNWINHDEIKVVALPDAGEFAPLTRALELFSQNATALFAGTNWANAPNFTLGLGLLKHGAGLLESYYYAAEARTGHEEQLMSLREKMRAGLKIMDAHPLPEPGRFRPEIDPRPDYDKLEWDEGGVCFDHPESALLFYHDLLKARGCPGQLPRLIGWSWPDRQRIPTVLHQFVNEVCADTNVTVHLEGLYLSLLLAPDDEQGSLLRREIELESAMWENRPALYSNQKNASLLEQTRLALIEKYHDDNIDKPFNHEPFAGFKHRLRMDFLAHSSQTNLAVIWELFPWTSVKMETPDQARELLPLAEAFARQLPSPAKLNSMLSNLRHSAGIASTNTPPTAGPTRPAEAVLEAEFIRWQLRHPGIDPGRIPKFQGLIFRNGRLWLHVLYLKKEDPWPLDDFPTTYVSVDIRGGVQDEIVFPDKLGVPGDLFEVSDDTLFVAAGGHLYGYKFQEKTWEEISAPMEGSSQLVWLRDRLFVNRNDGLLTVQPGSKKVQLLVSSRRSPPAGEIDTVWTDKIRIYPRADGRLGALAENRCFTFDLDTEHWNIRGMPLVGTNRYFNFGAAYTSPGGSECLLNAGPVYNRYLIGFWNDDEPAESLLMKQTRSHTKPPMAEKLLPPVRWDWPQNFPLESADFFADDKKLVVLSPLKDLNFFGPEPEEVVNFSDHRQATLFCFEPEFRQPLSLPVRFQSNGQPDDPFQRPPGDFMDFARRLDHHFGNPGFWLKTPDGYVFSTTSSGGHWLISNTMLEPGFQAQRQKLRQSAKPAVSVSTNQPTP